MRTAVAATVTDGGTGDRGTSGGVAAAEVVESLTGPPRTVGQEWSARRLRLTARARLAARARRAARALLPIRARLQAQTRWRAPTQARSGTRRAALAPPWA